MKNRVLTLTPLTAFALLLSLTAAMPASSQLAQIKNAGDALVFYPIQEAAGYALTVTGPCNFEFRTRAEKSEIVFELPKDAMDGAYSFSLDAKPRIDPEIMEILHKARATGDNEIVRRLCREGQLPNAPTNQSGGFTVAEGKIIFDTTPEAKREDVDEGRNAAALSPNPTTAPDAGLAASFQTATPRFLLASADTPVPTGRPGECVWARMKPGAGVAER